MPYDAEYYNKNKPSFKQYYLNYKANKKTMCEVCKKEYINLKLHVLSTKHKKNEELLKTCGDIVENITLFDPTIEDEMVGLNITE